MCSEASYLSSGFSGYARELLKRLYATNKYEIAEFASYAKVNDPRDSDIPWVLYANAPSDNDPRSREYNSNSENQFGKWRFDRVLLDFKLDIVFDIRDYWMNSYQQYSPFRSYYHWVVMPTIDSEPQQETWIDTYISADAIFTYSDFGRDVIIKQSNGHANYIDTTSPGVDLSTFVPMLNEQKEIRKAFGVPEDAFIVGSVVRNQKRKLIPDLFETIRLLKFTAPIAAGYNIHRFDLQIVERLSKKYNNLNKESRSNLFFMRDVVDIMDVMFLWFENNQDLTSYTLDNVRDYFSIPKEGAHDAIKDVKDTAEILIRFMKLHRRLSHKILFKDSFATSTV